MAASKITLPPALARFVEEQVASGAYPDAESVVHEALLRRMPRADADAFRIERFNALVQVGLDELDRGEGIVVDDIEAYLEGIVAEIEAESADKAA